MFHTILNIYDVFKPFEETVLREQKTYNGHLVDVVKMGENEYIDRLYSTDPFDYLNKDIYPFKRI
ncbi:MAG: YlzJ-like family protein [Ruminococcus sp.]|nr:YlzJ-like family protein [Ruminococcus sp.]MCD7773712.1 YlzJ-like family protein [Ruminococcus sp.]